MTVTERSDGKGWIFDAGVVDGKRVRITRKTQSQAREVMREFIERQRLHGDRAALADPAEIAAFLAAKDKLAAVGASIDQAVAYFLNHSRPAAGTVTLSELLALWARSRGEKRSGKHAKNCRLAVQALIDDLDAGGREAAGLGAPEIQRWIRRPEWSGATQESYRRNLSAVFGWAVSAGYLIANPCEGVVCEEPDLEGEIEFLTVDQCAALLQSALRNDAEILPYLVLGLFCGIRPGEIGRMTGAAIRLESREVVIDSAKNTARKRGRSRRIVDLAPNAAEWLSAVQIDPEAPICPENWRKRWDVIKGVVRPWPADGLRHTFATYHYAFHRSEAALQVLMGHYSAEVLHRHYRGLAHRADAERFWQLVP